jgi:uncharacterized protein YqjF (DUF2071 family)
VVDGGDGECPFTLRRALMWQRWESLTFVHWRYPRDLVQRRVPSGLTVEEHESSAWVGLVPFRMRVSLPGWAAPPWAGRFAETNVRTYVRDSHGRSGIWFFSFDAARLGAVVTARSLFHLPYFWSAMTVIRDERVIEYKARRRWPSPVATSRMRVRVGDELSAETLTAQEHFLTARWRVFSRGGRGLNFVEAEHPSWPLRRAELLELDDSLVTGAGLPPPGDDALVHYSDGVDVRLGPPRRVGL